MRNAGGGLMNRVIDTAAKTIAGQVSATLSLLGDRSQGKFGILLHHRVIRRIAGIPEPTFNVSPAKFGLQLEGLLDDGYQFWPLSRLLSLHRDGGSLGDERVIVLTFDDGLECLYHNAFPILRQLQVPATIFVNTAFLGSEEPFPFDRWGIENATKVSTSAVRPLSLAQCQEMIASGWVEIGAHTHTHADFRGRADEFEQDLRKNVEFLEQQLGLANVPFAFPFGRRDLGYVSDELIEAAKRTNVTCALSTECQLVDVGSDPFTWGRFNVYECDSPRTLRSRLRGWYDWAPHLQQRLAGVGKQLLRRTAAT
jgi:peptidoglycan/xylan/chitin deacetylase (PgdA/CDA1 family)